MGALNMQTQPDVPEERAHLNPDAPATGVATGVPCTPGTQSTPGQHTQTNQQNETPASNEPSCGQRATCARTSPSLCRDACDEPGAPGTTAPDWFRLTPSKMHASGPAHIPTGNPLKVSCACGCKQPVHSPHAHKQKRTPQKTFFTKHPSCSSPAMKQWTQMASQPPGQVRFWLPGKPGKEPHPLAATPTPRKETHALVGPVPCD